MGQAGRWRQVTQRVTTRIERWLKQKRRNPKNVKAARIAHHGKDEVRRAVVVRVVKIVDLAAEIAAAGDLAVIAGVTEGAGPVVDPEATGVATDRPKWIWKS